MRVWACLGAGGRERAWVCGCGWVCGVCVGACVGVFPCGWRAGVWVRQCVGVDVFVFLFFFKKMFDFF